jgi:uncharacterized protein (TIGR03067 family)
MKTAFFTLSLVVLLVATNLQAAAVQKEEKGATAKELVGSYEMVAGEKNGEKLPADRVKGSKVRITEEKIVVTDKDSKETFACTYKLDSSKSPAVITMVSSVKGQEGEVAKGLIQSEGEQVRLIYTLPDGAKPPTKFKTEPGQLMLVLKRVKE